MSAHLTGMDGVVTTLRPARFTAFVGGPRSFFHLAGDVYERVTDRDGSRVLPLSLSGAAREVVRLQMQACPTGRIGSVDLVALENARRLEALVNLARDYRRCGRDLPDLIA